MTTPLTEITGIGPAMAATLTENGFASAEDIAASDLKTLCTTPGIGPSSGEKILAAAIALVVLKEEIPLKPLKLSLIHI